MRFALYSTLTLLGGAQLASAACCFMSSAGGCGRAMSDPAFRIVPDGAENPAGDLVCCCFAANEQDCINLCVRQRQFLGIGVALMLEITGNLNGKVARHSMELVRMVRREEFNVAATNHSWPIMEQGAMNLDLSMYGMSFVLLRGGAMTNTVHLTKNVLTESRYPSFTFESRCEPGKADLAASSAPPTNFEDGSMRSGLPYCSYTGVKQATEYFQHITLSNCNFLRGLRRQATPPQRLNSKDVPVAFVWSHQALQRSR